MHSQVDELRLIDAFLAPFGLSRDARAAGPGVLSGPGDDCAVVRPSAGRKLVLKVDELVEGVHFDWRWFAPEDVGHKALAAAISDLAAAAARPRWFLCALGVHPGPDALDTARGMARGMAALARRHGCVLVGGNVTRAGAWSVSVTALGEATRPRGRGGARPGDAIVLLGELGKAALGLRLLRGARNKPASRARPAAIRAQLRPEPLVEAGLAAGNLASAAVDVSDGFLRDLGHVCAASRCGAEVDLNLLPLDPAVRSAGVELALSGGEDYALVFAVRPRNVAPLLSRLRRIRTPATLVGRFVPGRGIRLHEGGKPRPLPKRLGWDHLA
jgi:thiamine-monophosphate kinase